MYLPTIGRYTYLYTYTGYVYVGRIIMTDKTYTLSPYACAKIINTELAERGVEKVLPPQMFYTYVKKAYIPSENKKVNIVDLQVWFEGYYNKLMKIVPEKVEEVVPDSDGTVGEWSEEA